MLQTGTSLWAKFFNWFFAKSWKNVEEKKLEFQTSSARVWGRSEPIFEEEHFSTFFSRHFILCKGISLLPAPVK
jgi:hypothetical protein